MKGIVGEGIQVVHDGTVYAPAETADVPKAVAQFWIRLGWVDEVDDEPNEPATKAPSAKGAPKTTGRSAT
jgi:hypothetical protein